MNAAPRPAWSLLLALVLAGCPADSPSTAAGSGGAPPAGDRASTPASEPTPGASARDETPASPGPATTASEPSPAEPAPSEPAPEAATDAMNEVTTAWFASSRSSERPMREGELLDAMGGDGVMIDEVDPTVGRPTERRSTEAAPPAAAAPVAEDPPRRGRRTPAAAGRVTVTQVGEIVARAKKRAPDRANLEQTAGELAGLFEAAHARRQLTTPAVAAALVGLTEVAAAGVTLNTVERDDFMRAFARLGPAVQAAIADGAIDEDELRREVERAMERLKARADGF